MRATHHDFLSENPKCGKTLETNVHSHAIFDLLSEDRNITAMIEASKAGNPAIQATFSDVEGYYNRHLPSDFDLMNKQRRTVVGCMIKTILARFGYLPVQPKTRQQKEFSKSTRAQYFTSGTCYSFDTTAPATMRMRHIVEEIPQMNSNPLSS